MTINTFKIDDNTYEFAFSDSICDFSAEWDLENKNISSPLAKKLFGFPWTKKIKMQPQSLTLEKQSWVDWDILLEPLQGLLLEHVTNHPAEEKPPVTTISTAPHLNSPEAKKIEDYIKDSINPSLSLHGGWVELKNYSENTAYVLMGGGCQGCERSSQTLKEGIANALKNEFEFIKNIVDVTDHTAGENPYY